MLPSSIMLNDWINPIVMNDSESAAIYPFEHFVINDFFKKEIFKELQSIASCISENFFTKHPNGEYRFAVFNSPQFFKFIFSKNFRCFLKSKTGHILKHCPSYPVPQLYVFDNAYRGIDPHTDFSSGGQREYGMIFYLHQNWKHSYGGELGFFEKENLTNPLINIEPRPNTMVGFRITPTSFHSVKPSKPEWRRSTIVVDWLIEK